MTASEAGSDLLTQIEEGAAPQKVLEFAARGLVPLSPRELAHLLGTLLASGEATLKARRRRASDSSRRPRSGKRSSRRV